MLSEIFRILQIRSCSIEIQIHNLGNSYFFTFHKDFQNTTDFLKDKKKLIKTRWKLY